MIPKRIGVITSPSGAAIRDILHVLARRFCGGSGIDISRVCARRRGCRGDRGSDSPGRPARRVRCPHFGPRRRLARDLWAFNDEALTHAIVASPIPIVSGIGHEIDSTIADFAADVRAATPSAAAEIAVPDGEEWLASLGRIAQRLQRGLLRRVESQRERLRWLVGRAAQVSPSARLSQQTQRLDDLEQRMSRALRQILTDRRSALGERRSRLWQLSPVARVRGAVARQAALFARLKSRGTGAFVSCARATLPSCAHTQRGESACYVGPRLRHRQSRRRWDSAQRRRCGAGNDH